MAYKDFDGLSLDSTTQNTKILQSDGHTVELPDASFVRDAAMTRDGMDLVLDGPNGQILVKDYFADESQPNLVAPDGSTLTPDLVNSFAHSPQQYAGSATVNDESPVGAVQEVTGVATVTHLDGSKETITSGTPIYQGDVIETDATGAVNIMFLDETTFAVSEDARLAIDEYVYDPSTQSGETNFSVLKGVFVFTSGLIGRDDPDDVKIDTPVGSIGIRGTIIAGNVDTGEITVIEGAIVLTDHNGHEITLATQFETARFHGNDGIEHVGQLSAADVAQKFFVVSQVSPTLFSSINDAAEEQKSEDAPVQDAPAEEAPAEETKPQEDGLNTVTDEVTTEVVDALPPVPPPVAPQTVTGFTTTTSGLTVKDVTLVQDTNTGSAQTTVIAQTVANTTAAASTTLAEPGTPVLTGDQGGGGGAIAVNNSPTHHPEAPNAFFKGSEGQSWEYNFDKEFRDDGGHANLTYELSAATIAALNGWITDAGGPNPDILVAGGWAFNASNGRLELDFNTSFSTTPGMVSNLTIEVQARDADGAVSGYETYTYGAINAHSNTSLPGTYSTNNQVVSTLTPTAGTQINSNASTFYLGDGNDTLIFNTGTNNNAYMGDGNNQIFLMLGGRNNSVVGGDARDVFNTQNAAVRLYGMDGDDDFYLNLAGSTVLTDLATSGLNMMIDGGHSNFRAPVGQGLALTGELGGRGDSIVLDGAGVLDFRNIDPGNQFRSIERIDAASTVATQSIILRYSDILAMTDDKNALIINIDGADSLELIGMGGGFTRARNDVTIDDGLQGASSNRTYDVFTDGTVTLFISASGGASGNVTIDGAGVTV
jgi:hypothetical protein